MGGTPHKRYASRFHFESCKLNEALCSSASGSKERVARVEIVEHAGSDTEGLREDK
jgi:hypothetical protein